MAITSTNIRVSSSDDNFSSSQSLQLKVRQFIPTFDNSDLLLHFLTAMQQRFSDVNPVAVRQLNSLKSFFSLSRHSMTVGHHDSTKQSQNSSVSICMTFKAQQWIYHTILKINEACRFHASDLFRLNVIKALQTKSAMVLRPSTIVIQAVGNEQTLEIINKTGVNDPTMKEMFLSNTPLGKHMTYVCKEFEFDITKIEVVRTKKQNPDIILYIRPEPL